VVNPFINDVSIVEGVPSAGDVNISFSGGRLFEVTKIQYGNLEIVDIPFWFDGTGPPKPKTRLGTQNWYTQDDILTMNLPRINETGYVDLIFTSVYAAPAIYGLRPNVTYEFFQEKTFLFPIYVYFACRSNEKAVDTGRVDANGDPVFRCEICPDGAYCPGGDRMWPNQGYWSESEILPPQPCSQIDYCPGISEDQVTDALNLMAAVRKCSFS